MGVGGKLKTLVMFLLLPQQMSGKTAVICYHFRSCSSLNLILLFQVNSFVVSPVIPSSCVSASPSTCACISLL